MRRIAALLLVSVFLLSACENRSVLVGDAGPGSSDSRASPLDGTPPFGDLYWPNDSQLRSDGVVSCSSNVQCSGNDYCFIAGACQVTGAKLGQCLPRPKACPTYESPTCGCDGKTYGNPCEAAAAGVNVSHPGACSTKCGKLTIYPACGTGQVCDYRSCGAAEGECVKRPSKSDCDLMSAIIPVCGCDGVTYQHECYRLAAGVALAHSGACAMGQVTVVTDKGSYLQGEAMKVTLMNGLSKSLFLPGCSVYSWQRLESGKWVGHGASKICGWEGVAVEVKSGAALDGPEQAWAGGGTWRLHAAFGLGCLSGKPLSEAACTDVGEANSKSFTVEATAKECLALRTNYEQALSLAKKCNPAKSSPQCTVKVQSVLGCDPKITFVDNQSFLKPIVEAWTYSGCDKVTGLPTCPGPGPWSPLWGMCSTNNGLCVDMGDV